MKKYILFLFFVCSVVVANPNKGDKLFWEEVKSTNDIELLRAYQKEYPNGIFYRLAEIKIKRLQKEKHKLLSHDNEPLWVREIVNHRYFGVGYANKHYKGIDYQKNKAKSKAKKELLKLFQKNRLSEKRRHHYFRNIETQTYINKNKRVYVLVYVPNYMVE